MFWMGYGWLVQKTYYGRCWLSCATGSISWLAFDGDRMFSASEDGTIAVWQARTWTCIHTLTGHK